MQASNARYDAALARRHSQPAYFVVFGGISERLSTHRIKGATATYIKLMLIPTGTGAEIEILKGKAEIEDLEFEAVDRKNRITKLQTDNVMSNREVTVRKGFTDIDEVDFLIAFVGNVRSLSFDGKRYKFNCAVLDHIKKTTIFKGLAETETTSDIDAVATALVVESTAGFDAAGFIRVGNEMMQYTQVTATSFKGLTRGFKGFGEGAVAHTSGARVRHIVELKDNPIDIELQILTSTGTGSNGAFDVLPASQGIGLAQAKVDVAGFTFERDRWYGGLTYQFFLEKSFEAKKFMEEELFATTNSYPRTRSDGNVSLKIYASPLPTEPTVVVDEKSIRGTPRWDANFRDMRNRVEILFDYDPIDDEFDSILVLEDTDSQTTFGTTKTHIVEAKGIRTGLGASIFLPAMAARILGRFSIPPIRFRSLPLHMNKQLLEVGDLVEITHSKVPNDIGTKGISGDVYEIISRAVDWAKGEVELEVLATQFSASGDKGRVMVWNENDAPSFGAASAEEKKLGFWTENDGTMGNGEDPYVWA